MTIAYEMKVDVSYYVELCSKDHFFSTNAKIKKLFANWIKNIIKKLLVGFPIWNKISV